MKNWPTNPTTPSPHPLMGIEEAYQHALHGLPHEYEGLDIGEDEKAMCLRPNEVFDAIARDPSDALERVLYLAFQLGLEQGRRMHRRSLAPTLTLLLHQARLAPPDVSWMQGWYTEETGRPWPFVGGLEAAEHDDLGDHADLSL